MKAREDEERWLFNPADLYRAQTLFWPMPVRLLNDGTLRALLRPTTRAGARGGGAATSILLPLVLENFARQPGATWTQERPMSSVRRLAILSGIAEHTVMAGIDHLESLGLLRRRIIRENSRFPRARYSLAARLFATTEEPYVGIPGTLVFSAFWALLPRSSWRQALLTIAARAPVRDPERYAVGAAGADGETDQRAVIRHLERNSCTFAQLGRDSGMSVRAVSDAVGGLVVAGTVRGVDPLPGATSMGLVSVGPALDGGIWLMPRWREIESVGDGLLGPANHPLSRRETRARLAAAVKRGRSVIAFQRMEMRELGLFSEARSFWKTAHPVQQTQQARR